jgi:hypothetical protein
MSAGLFLTIFLADLAAIMVHTAIQDAKKARESFKQDTKHVA